MSIADIKSARRIWYGSVEAARVYRGSTLLFSGYDPDANALFDRFDTPATPERMRLISDRFVAGKALGWWSKLDAIGTTAAHGAIAGRQNWLADRFNLVPVNNPTFTVDRGYAGNGTTSYLDTQFNPFVEAPLGSNYQQNSASFGVRSNTENTSSSQIAGFYDGAKGTTIQPRTSDNRAGFFLNASAYSQSGQNISTTSVGMFAVSRTGPTTSSIFRNGVALNSTGLSSTTLADGNLRIGSITDTSLRNNQISMWFIGGGLTSAELTSIYNWFQPYRIALGIT